MTRARGKVDVVASGELRELMPRDRTEPESPATPRARTVEGRKRSRTYAPTPSQSRAISGVCWSDLNRGPLGYEVTGIITRTNTHQENPGDSRLGRLLVL